MVDIIIPAYNAFNTLGKTLESIANQVDRDKIKVYIVNDGSRDNYQYIINQYKDKVYIKEIYEENAGPGAARQLGLRKSHGEYIMFVDADDFFNDEYAITNLLQNAEEADIVEGMVKTITKDGEIVAEPLYCFLHGKLYRRSIIEKNKLKFDVKRRYDGDIYEDSTFNMLYYLFCDRIVKAEYCVYVYDYNPESITKTDYIRNRHLFNFIEAVTWFVDEIRKRKIQNKEHEIGWYSVINMYFIYFFYCCNPEEYDFVFRKAKKMKKLYVDYSDYVSYQEKLDLYFNYQNKTVIPPIAFNDFVNRIK